MNAQPICQAVIDWMNISGMNLTLYRPMPRFYICIYSFYIELKSVEIYNAGIFSQTKILNAEIFCHFNVVNPPEMSVHP